MKNRRDFLKWIITSVPAVLFFQYLPSNSVAKAKDWVKYANELAKLLGYGSASLMTKTWIGNLDVTLIESVTSEELNKKNITMEIWKIEWDCTKSIDEHWNLSFDSAYSYEARLNAALGYGGRRDGLSEKEDIKNEYLKLDGRMYKAKKVYLQMVGKDAGKDLGSFIEGSLDDLCRKIANKASKFIAKHDSHKEIDLVLTEED